MAKKKSNDDKILVSVDCLNSVEHEEETVGRTNAFLDSSGRLCIAEYELVKQNLNKALVEVACEVTSLERFSTHPA